MRGPRFLRLALACAALGCAQQLPFLESTDGPEAEALHEDGRADGSSTVEIRAIEGAPENGATESPRPEALAGPESSGESPDADATLDSLDRADAASLDLTPSSDRANDEPDTPEDVPFTCPNDAERDLPVPSPGWTSRTPCPIPTGTSPPARYASAMTYDVARGRMVMFGGSNGGQLWDTWEWNGTLGAWWERTPCNGDPSPSNTTRARLVFDRIRQRAVAVGTRVTEPQRLEVWEWNGLAGSWSDRTPATLPSSWPSPRSSEALAFDLDRRRVVMFGGAPLTGGGSLTDLWEWDPDSGIWIERAPKPAPQPWPGIGGEREMVYDESRRRTLLLGEGGRGYFEAWEWEGNAGTWADRTPRYIQGAFPPGRWAHTVAYDAARRRTVLFAGHEDKRDLWEWDGDTGTWTDRTPAAIPASWPAGRGAAVMAFDSSREVVTLFGGRPRFDKGYGDTWDWDGARGTWTERTPKPAATCWPPSLGSHVAAYDSAREKLVVFAGLTDGGWRQSAELWEWESRTGGWTNRTPSPLPPSWPRARGSAAMAYDAARARFVLFGGEVVPSTLGDTWEWASDIGTWAERSPVSAPAGRYGHVMTYDASRSRVVMFGGMADGSLINPASTWEWDGSAGLWMDRTPWPAPITGPGNRAYHSMSYDSARGVVVLVGGSGPSGPLNDVWEWNGVAAKWSNRTPAALPASWPSARLRHVTAFDRTRNRTVLLGGMEMYSALPDLWEWDGGSATWLDRTPALPAVDWPAARAGSVMVLDDRSAALVVFGGCQLRDVWEWRGQ